MSEKIKNIVIWAEKLFINESLMDISMVVEKGESIAITGLNRDDAKDMMEVLGCFKKPRNGKYICDYEDINSAEYDRLEALRREKIGWMFDSPMLFDDMKAVQNVALWMDYICPHKSAHEMGINILKDLGMDGKSLFHIDRLSGLEKAILSLARAVINKPQLLLAGDIFSWLKPEEAEVIMEYLSKLSADGMTIIVFTNLQRILSRFNRVIRL